MLSLCSVTACSLQPCVATTVSYTTQRRKCCLPPVPTWSSVSGNRCRTSPLLLLPADRTSITSRHCERRAQKATPIEKRREEWTEEDQSDRRLLWSTSIRFFQLSNPLSSACRAKVFRCVYFSVTKRWLVWQLSVYCITNSMTVYKRVNSRSHNIIFNNSAGRVPYFVTYVLKCYGFTRSLNVFSIQYFPSNPVRKHEYISLILNVAVVS